MYISDREKQFSALYDNYVQPMFNFGLRITGDRELIKDCIHDVFVKLYMKNDFEIRNVSSYLLISLRNKILDEFRRRSNLVETPVEEYAPVKSVEDVELSYLRQEKEQMQHKTVDVLMESLTRRQREAFTLYYIEERKYDDICTIMDMNYHSVRNLVHRGMLRLREAASV